MDWLYYLAVTILGMSEADFWNSTPDKIYRIAKIHINANSNNKEVDTYETPKKDKKINWYKVLD